MPLIRIHKMLKMCVQDNMYDKTEAQLESFLSKLVSEEKLILEGGVYRRKINAPNK
eukprot:CAMPEP_0198219854 /NCGR_PEP_ID=MMETSP1445-20131203/76515_1 /TAXON_ID=36898 /ORGANISM="Pyramimonas sp., Strain CCMP2087" /LENGTH=55 /DNA_ID=CAMNT_0043897419 /DNA_START=15 /DNA_END=182 /DNA_ORIENTATION=+